MTPKKISTGRSMPETKREKIFHPNSRKAGQAARTQLRKGKLAGQAVKRKNREHSLADKRGFLYHALPAEGVMSLTDLHDLIRDVWLTRHDAELEEERAARRKGRPKSMRESKLEEAKLQESEEYRTGLEVVDVTHAANIKLFREWDLNEAAYVHQLRHIMISSASPEVARVTRPGKHPSLSATPDLNPPDTDVVHDMFDDSAFASGGLANEMSIDRSI